MFKEKINSNKKEGIEKLINNPTSSDDEIELAFLQAITEQTISREEAADLAIQMTQKKPVAIGRIISKLSEVLGKNKI